MTGLEEEVIVLRWKNQVLEQALLAVIKIRLATDRGKHRARADQMMTVAVAGLAETLQKERPRAAE